MAIVLTRDDLSRDGEHGTFDLGGRHWHSLEQPWNDNKPFVSCVPKGEYDLVPWASQRWGDCYVMVNEDLNVYHSRNSAGRPDDGRYKCLFVHRGNWVRNFQGCIGASMGYDVDGDMLKSPTAKYCRTVNRLVKEEGSMILRIE